MCWRTSHPWDEVKRRYPASPSNRLVGLLPGSRQSELRALLPTLLDCADLLQRRCPTLLSSFPSRPLWISASLEALVTPRGLPLRLISGDTYGVIRACDLLLTVSGTATLEAAILGTPMIITNRVSNLSYHLGHRLIKIPWIGLPNLIAGHRIVPEYVQQDAQPELLAEEATNLLQHPERLQEQRRELGFIRTRWENPGSRTE